MMEGFSFSESWVDPLEKAQEIAEQKIAAYKAAQSVHEVLQTDGITSLLQIIVGHALPLI